MPRCLIRTCPISSSTKASEYRVHLHVFPKELERIKTWLLCTGHPFKDLNAYADRIFSAKANDSFRICSSHFPKDSYYMKGNVRLLRPEALPCIIPLIPGIPIINEEIRLRVARKRRLSPPPSSVAGSSTQSQGVVPFKKSALKVDADTQTNLQYTTCIITPQKVQPVPVGLLRVHHGYHYLISTPMKLKEGTMTPEVNGAFLEIPVCEREIGARCKTETINTRVTLLSPGSHVTGAPYSGMAGLDEERDPCNVKEEESSADMDSLIEEHGLRIIKVEESCIDIACPEEEYDPCHDKVEEEAFSEERRLFNVKEEESCIEIDSVNEEHRLPVVKTEESCDDIGCPKGEYDLCKVKEEVEY